MLIDLGLACVTINPSDNCIIIFLDIPSLETGLRLGTLVGIHSLVIGEELEI